MKLLFAFFQEYTHFLRHFPVADLAHDCLLSRPIFLHSVLCRFILMAYVSHRHRYANGVFLVEALTPRTGIFGKCVDLDLNVFKEDIVSGEVQS